MPDLGGEIKFKCILSRGAKKEKAIKIRSKNLFISNAFILLNKSSYTTKKAARHKVD